MNSQRRPGGVTLRFNAILQDPTHAESSIRSAAGLHSKRSATGSFGRDIAEDSLRVLRAGAIRAAL